MINNDNIDALKLAIDTLEYDVIRYIHHTRGGKSIEYTQIKENKVTYFNCLKEYLNSKKIRSIELFLKDIIAINLYFYLNGNENVFYDLTERVKGIIQYILLIIERKEDSKYCIECIFNDTLLNNNDLFDAEDSVTSVLDYYYSLYYDMKEIINGSIWNMLDDIERVNSIYKLLNYEEIHQLKLIKERVENSTFIVSKNDADDILDIISNDVDIEDVEEKIKNIYDINYLIGELKEFKDFDDTIGKNTYKETTKESVFHQHIYPYLCRVMGKDNGVIHSEVSTGRERYDLYYYDIKRDMSVIIELKVNNLAQVADNINQLDGYLDKTGYKESIFAKEPSFGILLVYDVGSKKLKDKCNENIIQKEACVTSNIDDNILFLPNKSKPIVVFVLGENKIDLKKNKKTS